MTRSRRNTGTQEESRERIHRTQSRRGWNKDNEELCKRIYNKHAALVWICNKSAKRAETMNKAIGVIIAAGLYLFGTTGLPTVFTDSDDNSTSETIFIVLSIMAIAFGLLKTVVVALQLEKKIGKNRWASGMHAEITLMIRKEVDKKKYKREKWRKFHRRIAEKEIELQSNSPTAPKAVIKSYYKRFGDLSIKQIVLFGDIALLETADSIYVEDAPQNKSIVKAVKQQRQRKKDLRSALSDDEHTYSAPAVSSSSYSAEVRATYAPSDDAPTPSSTSDPAYTSESQTSETSESSPEPSPEPEPSPPSPPASPRVRRRTSAKNKQSRESVEEKRHDLRDRYELERYFMS